MYCQRIENLHTQIFTTLEKDTKEVDIMEIKFIDSKSLDQKDDTVTMSRPSEIMDIIDELSPVTDFKLEDDNIPVFREKNVHLLLQLY